MLYVVLGILLPSPAIALRVDGRLASPLLLLTPLTGIAALALLMETEHHE